jgi:hypothetical protein
MSVKIIKITFFFFFFFSKKKNRKNCKDLGVSWDLTKFVKIPIYKGYFKIFDRI